jgi:pimeloyl-ACP methyl ester carboxylesterase
MAAFNVLAALAGLLALTLVCLALVAAFTKWKAEQLLPPAGKFLDIDGARVHYAVMGEGPPIVLIHGFSCVMQIFTYALTGLLKGHRLVVFDRPGCGYSLPRPSNSAGVRAQAAILAKAIRMLKLEKPLIVGHSLGGAVALAMAVDQPELAGGLALIAPLTRSGKRIPDAFKAFEVRPALLRWLISWTFAVPAAIKNGRKIGSSVFSPEPAPEDYLIRAGGVLGLRPGAFRTACEDLLAIPDDVRAIAGRYAEIHIPVSVLYGDQDAVLNYKAHGLSMETAIPHAKGRILEGRGHMLPISAPAETAEFVLEAARATV